MADIFVVVTRYTPEKGDDVVHTYGPHETRSLATSAASKIKRDAARDLLPYTGGKLRVSVCKVLGSWSEDPR